MGEFANIGIVNAHLCNSWLYVCFFDLRALRILIISEAQAKDDSTSITQRRGGASPYSPTIEHVICDLSRFESPSHGNWSFRNVNKLTGVTCSDSPVVTDPKYVVPLFIWDVIRTGGRKP